MSKCIQKENCKLFKKQDNNGGKNVGIKGLVNL